MKDKVKKTIIDVVEVLLIAYIISFVIKTFFISPVLVKEHSMLSTLNNNDFGFSFVVNENKELDRFDIVVIDNGEYLIVKRLIGLPNETIEYKDNKLYINGEYYKEDFLDDDIYTNELKIELKDNEYYCLGDNRESSIDSRVHGPFLREDIKSRHVFVLYPFSNWGYKK